MTAQTEAGGSGMVERIEAAIVAKMGVFISPSRRTDMARAMLEAIREPTEAMLAAADSGRPPWYGETLHLDPRDTWQAMISAALEESET